MNILISIAVLIVNQTVFAITPNCDVYINKHAIVYVQYKEEQTLVLNLHQSHTKQVKVITPKLNIVLAPARFCFIGEHFNIPNNIHVYNVNKLADDIYIGSYTIIDALKYIPELHKLSVSNDKNDRKILNKILLTASILQGSMPNTVLSQITVLPYNHTH